MINIKNWYKLFLSSFYVKDWIFQILSMRINFLLFSESINVVSIFVLYLHWVHFLLDNFFLKSFARQKEFIISRKARSTFSYVVAPLTCAGAIGNFWKILLKNVGFKSFSMKWSMFNIRCTCRIFLK